MEPAVMTTRRRTILLLTCLFLAAAGTLFAASQSRTVRRYVLLWAETRISESLGREVRVEGIRLQPWLGALDLIGIRVAHDRRLADGVLFSAERLRARWGWTALLHRRIVLERLVLTRPQLTLPAPTAPGPGMVDLLAVLLEPRWAERMGWTLHLRQASVHEGRATWIQADKTPGSLEGVEGVLRWSETPDQPPQVTGSLRAARMQSGVGEAERRLEKIGLEVTGNVKTLGISSAEFHLAGARVSVQGQVQEPGRAPSLDLRLNLLAPLDSVLAALHTSRRLEGALMLAGHLHGPWEQVSFQGEGNLQVGSDAKKTPLFRFGVHWADGRLEAASLPGAQPADTFRGTLGLTPATGAFQARASVTNADLAALTGLSRALATLAGLQLPEELRGSLTADMDLAGRGTDVTTLRGYASLHVDGLGVAGKTPAGRLDARLVATSTAVQVQNFTLELPGGDIQGKGGLDLGSGKLDLPLQADLRDVSAFAWGFGLPFLAGQATLAGRLTGTRDQPRLLTRLAWREARIAMQTFDQIEGEVEVAPRMIRTSRLTLRTGQTVAVLRGSVEAAGTTPLRQLDLKRDLNLDVQGQLNPARTADLVALLPADLEIQGAFRASGRLTGAPKALNGDVKLQLESFRTWDESWLRGDALLHFREGAAEISQISLRRGEEQLSGEILLSADGALGGVLTSTPMDLSTVGSLEGSQLTGRGSFRLDLQGSLHDTRTLGQVTATALSYRDIPLGPGTATFTLERKMLDLDLTVREGGYRLQVHLSPPPNRSLRGALSLHEADLDLLFQVAEVSALRPWKVRASGRLQMRGPAADLSAHQGEAEFERLDLRRDGVVWENRGPVQVQWNRRTLTLGALQLRSGEHELDIRGSAGDGTSTDLSVTGSLPLTELPGMPPEVQPTAGSAIANLRIRGSWDAPEVQGKLEIQGGRLSLSGLKPELTQVQATLALSGNRWEVRDWRAHLAEGALRGGAELRRQDGRWKLRATFQEDGGRAEQLLAGLYGGKGEVAGSLSLGGLLASEGEASADFWRNLDGDLKLRMKDGRIGSYTVLAKILSLLSVTQALELKSPELGAEGMPYQSLTADIKIQHGIARTDNLMLESRAMKVNAVGTVNLAEETVDLKVGVKPFQTVDTILSHIPLAGRLLTGKEQSLVVAYYQVSGSLRDPQVAAIPLQSVGRNIFGIFKNLLELPEVITGPYEDLPPQAPKPDEGQDR
jgi:autotransporter translocation and assembly factor TamB